ncbi:MAG: hypothetical protein ACK5UG_09180 [Synechococcaceae cyanobacterium]
MGRSAPATTLHLHVGIHKTASTTIQHRLQANHALLASHGLLVPRLRRQHMALVRALQAGCFDPWEAQLEQASARGCHLLISAEVLSLELARSAGGSASGAPSHLAWLRQQLERRGVRLHLVAFVRDQPAYLNSRYTQLIKRFYFSHRFDEYVAAVLAGRQDESCCDFRMLFADALEDPAVETSFLPFPGDGSDPCERLLAELPVAVSLEPIDRALANAQPGWRTVWLAHWLAGRLRANHPQLWRDSEVRRGLRRRLERLAEQQGWPADPFVGLTLRLQRQIESHFAASNDWFAQRAWGCSWRDRMAAPDRPTPCCRPADPLERQQLVAIGQQLLADVSRSSVSRRP